MPARIDVSFIALLFLRCLLIRYILILHRMWLIVLYLQGSKPSINFYTPIV